ncbi:RNA degradosome polyphosphate kinase, partial [Pseudomonas syringae pv. tagetis]
LLPAFVDPCAAVPVILAPYLDYIRLYIHRELSKLQFNIRFLEYAIDESFPLLERLLFLLILCINLDVFFEIGVCGLKMQITFARVQSGADCLQRHDALARISDLVHGHVDRQY